MEKIICAWCNKKIGVDIKNYDGKRPLHKKCVFEKRRQEDLDDMLKEYNAKQKRKEELAKELEELRCEKIRAERAIRLAKYKIKLVEV